MENLDFFLDKISQNFIERKKINPSYSLRSYARYLQMDASTLSKILKGKRSLSINMIHSIGVKLKLSNDEYQKFYRSVISKYGLGELALINQKNYILNDDIHFKIIAHWQYYALLNLTSLKDYKEDFLWMANRLGLDPSDVKYMWNELYIFGLIKKSSSGQVERVHKNFSTTQDILSKALQYAHTEELMLAKRSMTDININERENISVVIPTNPKKIKKAKSLIRYFCQQMESLLESGDKTEVYQLCIHLFPLSQKLKKKGTQK